jgi:formylglycine-generating enzyme required for sulfatase activity
LKQAVRGLAREGKIICVRLALFAEIMKGKPWSPTSLKQAGGTEGVGVTFLEETFSATRAPPERRYHQKAARAVLKALLPQSGTEIKGHMRSYAELLDKAGYADHPPEFDDLIRILDSEVRLISPTDPTGLDGEGVAASQVEVGQKYYQLTHDYLVPSLREWLTRKQKETRRGRAELALADRTGIWNARPENRQLPGLLQWVSICLLTRKQNWAEPQRQMMRSAARYHGVRGTVFAIILAILSWGSYEGYGRLKAQALRDRLLDANTAEVPTIVKDMAGYWPWVDPLLRDAYQQAEANHETRKQLHASLALLTVDSSLVDQVFCRLLDAAPHEVPVIRDALLAHKQLLLEKLWSVVERPAKGQEHRRLRAACALASYDPDNQRWANVRDAIAQDLVTVPAVYLASWMDCLRPVRGKLLGPLTAVFEDGNRRETERSLATDLLVDYAVDQPRVLADLLMNASENQFAALYPKIVDHRQRALSLLQDEVDKQLLPGSDEDAKERLARRQANAGVALLRLGQAEKVWPLLRHRTDPRVRSYVIHRLGRLGADPRTVIKRLKEEQEVSTRRALLLCLGEQELAGSDREALLPGLFGFYREDPDPGIHGSAAWLLRRWQQGSKLDEMDRAWARDQAGREQRLAHLREEFAKEPGQAKPQWYINSQAQTFVIIPGPVEFRMGSPPTEAGRDRDEQLHRQLIGRTFALATTPVTVEQFRRFRPDFHPEQMHRYPQPSCPIGGVNWYDATAYCNWLSKQEGLPEAEWCYEPNAQGKFAEGMKAAPDYLKRTGYRLATEAEWEYGCRAGAVTSRYYGETAELLGKYAWYFGPSHDRTWPVASLKPNDLGLFDMHGNVWTWCQEPYLSYEGTKDGTPVEDIQDTPYVKDRDGRAMRGGAFGYIAVFERSATRSWNLPWLRNFHIGFRVARTFR